MTPVSAPQKIIVLNFSGNVGKSTVAKHLLAANMPGAPIVSVETINAGAASELQVKGSAFGQLQEDILLVDQVIVDVGASNVEQFLSLMRQYRGSHQDFDLFLVPCVPVAKQQEDTIKCVRDLAKIGIPASRILLLFNLVSPDEKVTDVFAPLFNFVAAEGLAKADERLVVYESELFARLKTNDRSVAEVCADQTDFKANIRNAKSSDEKLAWAEKLATHRIATGVQENLTAVFSVLKSL